jgi:hypothetical protein
VVRKAKLKERTLRTPRKIKKERGRLIKLSRLFIDGIASTPSLPALLIPEFDAQKYLLAIVIHAIDDS